jgi:hypothetical protein
MSRNINYNKRGFAEVRGELYNLVRQYYPNLIGDFDDMSVGGMMIDLNAAVSDHLSFHTDRLFQETQLGNAQQRRSLFELAKTNGTKIPNKKAAVTVVEFTVSVPAYGDTFDTTYLPILKSGAQVTGGGKVFETIFDIDFNSPYSQYGTHNRLVIPIQNTITGAVIRYEITKKEVVFNGITRIFKKIITSNEEDFMSVILPEQDVLSVTSVIFKDGFVNGNPEDSDYYDNNIRFHEVEALAQPYIFLDKDKDSNHIKAGEWQKVSKKFIKEFTEKGFCKLTFGNGAVNEDYLHDLIKSDTILNNLEGYLSSSALGEKPKNNSTMYVKYRVGGGANTNVGAKVLNSLGSHSLIVNGSNEEINNAVKRSIRVTNPIPAFGGKDAPSNEEIRYMVAYNNASQNRCVTLHDYLSMVYKMDGRYGSPFKATAFKQDNKVVISILGLDEFGKLAYGSAETLQANIAAWLSEYRMINDYVEVRTGRVYHLAYDIELFVEDNAESVEVIRKAAIEVSNYHNIHDRQMNEDIPLGRLIEALNNVAGVQNVVNMKVYNKTTGKYSPYATEMEILNPETGEIKLENNTLYASNDSMFEIKNPERDIRITVVRSNKRIF